MTSKGIGIKRRNYVSSFLQSNKLVVGMCPDAQ
jgi:hypothetical protein